MQFGIWYKAYLLYFLGSRIFDQFTRSDYEQYMRYKTMHGNLDDDLDPVAWFTISKERHEVVRLNDRLDYLSH